MSRLGSLSLRLGSLLELVAATVPPPARLLEVGCGGGELARALDERRYDVTAIDPDAPSGPIFRKVALEDFRDAAGFDVVVASVALHHLADLRRGFEHLAELIRPDGKLILDEFDKERIDGATARWYHRRLRELGRDGVPADFSAWHTALTERLHDVHPFGELAAELDRRFERSWLERTPYLYDYRLDDSLEPVERAAIAADEIEAVGVRWIGEPRFPTSATAT